MPKKPEPLAPGSALPLIRQYDFTKSTKDIIMNKKLIVTAIWALSVPVSVAAGETREIPFSRLPQAVQQSALQQLRRDAVSRVEAIQENGMTTYEIESGANGFNKDITLADDGSLLEIEQTIALDQLPTAARAALREKYPHLSMAKLESVQKFYFDVEGVQQGKPLKLKVLATGMINEEK